MGVEDARVAGRGEPGRDDPRGRVNRTRGGLRKRREQDASSRNETTHAAGSTAPDGGLRKRREQDASSRNETTHAAGSTAPDGGYGKSVRWATGAIAPQETWSAAVALK